jgi:diguanylate cyclase (GGDEF)-like protein/PAS domain S-box-containing protein
MYEPAVQLSRLPRSIGTVAPIDRYEATFHSAPVGIAHVNPDGAFVEVNEQFAAITGRSRAELLQDGFQGITHPDDLQSDLAHVGRLLDGESDRYRMEKRYLRPDGSTVWVALTVALIRDPLGEPDYFISVIEDLSEIRRAREEATRDPLTGLLNRRGFNARLQRERAQAAASGTPWSLLYIDLDSFKQINDALGHAKGDESLVAVARALGDTAAPGDRIARVGGDEFVILLPATDAIAAAERVAAIHRSLSGIAIAPGWPIQASVGTITVSGDDPRSDADLVAAADSAMFAAKRAAR